MNFFRTFGVGCATSLLVLTGCSSQDSASADNQVTFGDADAGPITSVSCESDESKVTITAEGSQETVLIVSDSDSPELHSLTIGEAGGADPSLLYLQGVSDAPEVSRKGNQFTISGVALGTDNPEATSPVELPFSITLSCP